MKKLHLVWLFLLVSCAGGLEKANRSVASEASWSFLVLSDIHVYTTTKDGRKIVPKNFSSLVEKLIPYVEENNVKFIVLLGDSTGGNEGDSHSLKTVKMWWDELKLSLAPLIKKGVKIFPVAGNHDFYTNNHKEGYEYAWRSFVDPQNQEIQLNVPSPLYYTLSYGGLELFLLHAVTYDLGKEQELWLKKITSENKDNGQLKIALGHVALYTRLIKKPFIAFGDKVRNILTEGNVKHYIAGHEHYFWDELIGPEKMRQTIMGTSSGTYNFAPNLKHYSKFCKNGLCKLEPDGIQFRVNIKDRKQVFKQMFLHFEVDESARNYNMIPMAFHKGSVVPFRQD